MYTIITDSCCDLNPAIIRKYEQFEIVPLSYTMGGVTKPQPIDDEAAVHAYYDRLRAGEMSTTSQVSPAQWQEAFSRHVKNGEQVLCWPFRPVFPAPTAPPAWRGTWCWRRCRTR